MPLGKKSLRTMPFFHGITGMGQLLQRPEDLDFCIISTCEEEIVAVDDPENRKDLTNSKLLG
jgi:hypothetical protein